MHKLEGCNLNTSLIDPKANLFRHFTKFIKLSDALTSELDSRMDFISFKKGDILQNANKVCTTSYFLVKGIVRIYYLKDGKEISEYFCGENEWVNSPKSFVQGEPDIYYIDAIENIDAYAIHVKDLVYLFDNFPEMERYSRLSMGSVFGHLMERITSLRFTSAKEKYSHFITTYHDIYHRIPLGMIASYLGITQETLSRIRSEKTF